MANPDFLNPSFFKPSNNLKRWFPFPQLNTTILPRFLELSCFSNQFPFPWRFEKSGLHCKYNYNINPNYKKILECDWLPAALIRGANIIGQL